MERLNSDWSPPRATDRSWTRNSGSSPCFLKLVLATEAKAMACARYQRHRTASSIGYRATALSYFAASTPASFPPTSPEF